MNKWLKDAILYEIYPMSFMDGNGDGTGDFKGMTEKLDYVRELGVNILWLNPFFLSPFRDGGYDIADYKKIDPRFGTMEDFEFFVARCKQSGIKILIDFVPGHTSVEHEWFKRSAEGERNEYSDYYIWTDSLFTSGNNKMIKGMYERDGGYFANYYACQPAINYGWNTLDDDSGKDGDSLYKLNGNWKMHYKDERLKPVRNAMTDVMLFWLRKGIDGFRVDCASDIVKGCRYDAKDDKDIEGLIFTWNKLFEGVKKEFPDCIFLSEWIYPENSVGKCGFDFDYLSHDDLYYNSLFRCEKGTNLLPGFENGNNYFSKNGKGNAGYFADYYQELLKKTDGKGYVSVPTGCHDEIRLATGAGDYNVIKTVYAFLLTLKTVPLIYCGDEIGIKHDFALHKNGGSIRTGCRTPMQWTAGKNRGFSAADSKDLYLPVNNDKGIDVETQEKEKNSILNTVKKLISIRKKYSCLNADGKQEFVSCGYPLDFIRSDEKNTVRIIINPSDIICKANINYKEILFSENVRADGDEIILDAQSFVLALIF